MTTEGKKLLANFLRGPYQVVVLGALGRWCPVVVVVGTVVVGGGRRRGVGRRS